MSNTVRNRQEGIVTLYFNRGAYVAVQDVGGTRRGYIECEIKDRPGWYYVRERADELTLTAGNLFLAQWQRMRLIGPDESPSA